MNNLQRLAKQKQQLVLRCQDLAQQVADTQAELVRLRTRERGTRVLLVLVAVALGLFIAAGAAQ